MVGTLRSAHPTSSASQRLYDSNRDSELLLCGERTEHTLHQRRIAVFLDLLDLAVLDPPHHAVLIVVALPGLGDIVPAGFDDDVVALCDKIERQRARPPGGEARPQMTHQAVLDRIAAPEFVRPRILAGDDPGHILGEVVDEGGSALVGGMW